MEQEPRSTDMNVLIDRHENFITRLACYDIRFARLSSAQLERLVMEACSTSVARMVSAYLDNSTMNHQQRLCVDEALTQAVEQIIHYGRG